jgi:peptidoglycan/xylan/chitin deacetylase (PgdA/CDA1 family)
MDRTEITAVIKTIFLYSGLIYLIRKLNSGSDAIPVLRYHSVSENADYCPSSIAVSPARFEKQIAYLTSRYRIVSLADVTDCLISGKPFPKRSAVITFDDGYLDNYTYALPILQRYGATATFFIVAGSLLGEQAFWVGALQQAVMIAPDIIPLAEEFDVEIQTECDYKQQRQFLIDQISIQINRSDLHGVKRMLSRVEQALGRAFMSESSDWFMMREKHAQELVAAKMTIGSHTVSHPILSSLTEDQAMNELQNSRLMIENVINQPVKHIAYPNGPGVKNFSAETLRLTRECDYQAGWTSERGPIVSDSERFSLPRQGVNQALNLGAFAFKLEEHHFGPVLLGN